MIRRRAPLSHSSTIAFRNNAPMHSAGCNDEVRQLEEFLKKRFPQQRAYLTATSDFAQAAENAGN